MEDTIHTRWGTIYESGRLSQHVPDPWWQRSGKANDGWYTLWGKVDMRNTSPRPLRIVPQSERRVYVRENERKRCRAKRVRNASFDEHKAICGTETMWGYVEFIACSRSRIGVKPPSRYWCTTERDPFSFLGLRRCPRPTHNPSDDDVSRVYEASLTSLEDC